MAFWPIPLQYARYLVDVAFVNVSYELNGPSTTQTVRLQIAVTCKQQEEQNHPQIEFEAVYNGSCASVNSLRLRDAYMRHQPRPSLVQLKACGRFGAQPLYEPMLYHCQLDPRNKLQSNCLRNSNIFVQENATENVVCGANHFRNIKYQINLDTLHTVWTGWYHMECCKYLKCLPKVSLPGGLSKLHIFRYHRI